MTSVLIAGTNAAYAAVKIPVKQNPRLDLQIFLAFYKRTTQGCIPSDHDLTMTIVPRPWDIGHICL